VADHAGLQARLGGRRGFAVAIMTLVLLLVIVVPLILAISAIAGKVDDIAVRVKSLSSFTMPPPPEWVNNIPLAGRRLAERWQQYAAFSPEELSALVTPYARTIMNWFLAQAGSIAAMILQFLLTVIMSAVMYAGGETAASGIRRLRETPGRATWRGGCCSRVKGYQKCCSRHYCHSCYSDRYSRPRIAYLGRARSAGADRQWSLCSALPSSDLSW